MSGICAIWREKEPRGASAPLAAMTSAMSLDAAESTRQTCLEGAGVGVVARFESQQMHESDTLLVATDADLLNEKELAETIGGLKPGMNTAALVAALYRKHGCDFAAKLRGGFAVVLWDQREKRLLAAIDGFGIKRLAYYRDEKGMLVATRVDALVRTGLVPDAINPHALANILNFSSNLGPGTIFSKVQRLIPGAVLVASPGRLQVNQYWDMRYGVSSGSSEAKLSRELESTFERSVADHCGNAPQAHLGAFLSGGTDSSTVVGMMTRKAGGPVKAFSIGFDEQRYNELEYAEIAARRFGSEHFTYLVGARDCLQALPRILRQFDEPFGNSSAIPTYFCAHLAAQHGVKTLLAGDGGDELFGGNERYATDKIFEAYHYIPKVLRKGLIEPALRIPVPGTFMRRARGYVRRSNMPGVQRMLSSQFLQVYPLAEVFEGDFLRAAKDYSIVETPARHYAAAAARDHLDRLLYVDMKITLADNDLPKVTCASELAGVQVRFPFLDRSVAEFSGRVPARLKVKGFKKRYLFKRAFRELLPVEIIQKKKHGFGIPVANWMKTDPGIRELSRDLLLSRRASERGYFRRQCIEDLLAKHDAEGSSYYGDILWTFLAIELWHRQVVDAPAGMAV